MVESITLLFKRRKERISSDNRKPLKMDQDDGPDARQLQTVGQTIRLLAHQGLFVSLFNLGRDVYTPVLKVILARRYKGSFANRIQRPFGVRYNPYTQSVEVLSNAEKIVTLVSELRGDLCIVSNALRKIHAQDETVDVESITNLLHSGIQVQGDQHDQQEQ
uniref:Biopterin-dependent aromatic amino acid hydroxylase family profile domain-containing protein n=1 Tax=Timema tahoe TaxID=61484 RepID=A0A7R9IK19_9NEOP|nr:unnamed protein product [Timema tahoe]